MTIISDHGRLGPLPLSETQPSRRRTERESEPTGLKGINQQTSPESQRGIPVHNPESLRATVTKLLDSGEIRTTPDGPVRTGRVDRARKNSAAGDYDRGDVLAAIVDRLLAQWNI